MFISKRLQNIAFSSCFLCLLTLSARIETKAQANQVQVSAMPDSSSVPPAEAFRVLPQPGAEAPSITPYLLYQTSLAWRQDALRRTRWSQVKTESDLLQLRAELRKSVLEMIGGLPTEKTDLHPTVTGRVSSDGFHIEKLVYQSLPGFYVTALVYVPEDGSRIHPAVLVPAGHSSNGKIHYQDLCQRLVHRGYLVISWDPIGQGERSQFWNAKEKKSRYNLICAEHAVLGNLAYLAGANLARWEIWDGMRAVDYLLTRSDVDSQRISITGTSGGGFQTSLLGALDERIRVIIPSCYITALPMRVENRIFADPDSDPEQDLFGFISKGVDHAGLLLMMYPRPVMVATATLDFFPIQGAHQSYGEVRTFYERFGHGDRVAFTESYNPHQYSLHNQEAALDFLDRFNKMPLRHGLAPTILFKDADLLVTKTGQIAEEYPGSPPLISFIQQYAAEEKHGSHPTFLQLYQSEQDPQISSWTVHQFDGAVPAQQLRWETIGASTTGRVHVDRYLLHHSTYLAMPMLHFHIDEGGSKGAAIWFSPHGKATREDWPEVAKLLSDGYEVYSFDFRGLGETRMNYRARSTDDPDLVQGDFDEAYSNPLSSVLAGYAYNSILLGRPYFLQMLDDIKIAALFIHRGQHRPQTPDRAITIAVNHDPLGLAVRLKQIDPDIVVLLAASGPSLDWSMIMNQDQERWPAALLMPSGALLDR